MCQLNAKENGLEIVPMDDMAYCYDFKVGGTREDYHDLILRRAY